MSLVEQPVKHNSWVYAAQTGAPRCRKLEAMDAKQFQKIAKALADPRRFEILSRIARHDELACSDMRCDLPITAATLSHHLKELANAGLIDLRRDRKFVHMKLRRKVWLDYLARLSKL